METIHESADLKVLYRRGGSRETWVAFGAHTARSPEADILFAHRPGSAIHFISKTDDWYQTADMTVAIKAARKRLKGRVITIGASMGGYAAVAFAADLGAKVVIAGSPQISLDPQVDGRWAEAWSTLPQYKPDARVGLFGKPDVYALYDYSYREDADQVSLLPTSATRMRLPMAGHEVFRVLKDMGLLRSAIDAMADGDRAALAHTEAAFAFEAPRRCWAR